MACTSTPNYDQVRQEYDSQATEYNQLLKTPFGILESQLVENALKGDGSLCRGAVVLDLGGGTGMRARQALALGAARVDVVDLSAEMMEVGRRDAERLLGVEFAAAKMRWFLHDVSEPLYSSRDGDGSEKGGLVGIGDRGSYDIVMGNWIFDHISDISVLEAMWRNISSALRPGGRFLGVRACDPRTPAMTTGKYGPTCQDFSPFPGGLIYSSTIPADPPVHLDNASLEISYSGSTELHRRHGLGNVRVESPEGTEVVRSDPEFWDLWLRQPGFVVVKAERE